MIPAVMQKLYNGKIWLTNQRKRDLFLPTLMNQILWSKRFQTVIYLQKGLIRVKYSKSLVTSKQMSNFKGLFS